MELRTLRNSNPRDVPRELRSRLRHRCNKERALGFHKYWSKFETIFYFSFRSPVLIPSDGCYSFSSPGRNRRKWIQKRRWTVLQRKFLMNLLTWPLNDNEAEVALSYLAFQSIEELYIHQKNGKGHLLATAIWYLFDVRVRYVTKLFLACIQQYISRCRNKRVILEYNFTASFVINCLTL